MEEEKSLTLADIPEKGMCVIAKIHGHGGFRNRIMELGFVKGQTVKVLKKAPLKDPVEYEIMGSHISLRRSEAENIEVVSLDENSHPDFNFNGTIEEHVASEVEQITRHIRVALVGNPNCGKTSFFNFATGLHEKVGNYSGVTVESKVGTFFHDGYTIDLVDLPGTYSLTEYSPEEIYVRNYIVEQKPDVVLNIVDAGNLERNMFLTTQLIDMNPRIVMALNMYDELLASGDKLDYNSLARMLGFPIVPVVARTGQGIDDVLAKIVEVYCDNAGSKHIHINYGDNVESAIRKVKKLVEENVQIRDQYHGRYVAIKLIENDSVTHNMVGKYPNYKAIKQTCDTVRDELQKEYRDDIKSIISGLKYGFIKGALSETLTPAEKDNKKRKYSLDAILTHQWLGIPILILLLWLMFKATFSIGAYPQQWLEAGIAALGSWVGSIMPEGMLRDLVVDGIIAGVGGVLVFLPNILILFLFISFFEDSGYMARVAFIVDKLMHKIGLHGKSFIPYIIGFGCSVPAIMATRTLESRKDRILTIITIPFMSCSARLPVFLLFVSAFFKKNQALVLISLYLAGILVAVLTSLLMNKLVFRNVSDQFVMELPPYRFPTVRNTLRHMWDKSAQYLKKMGTVILAASVIIWALGYFPRAKEGQSEAEHTASSYIGQIGKAIQPAFAPLGFDWKMSVSLLTGFAAKEVVVSSLGVLYSADGAELEEASVGGALQQAVDAQGNKVFTQPVVWSFLIFVLLYFPCVAAVSAVAKEAGRKWAWFVIFYTLAVAWLAAFGVYHLAAIL
ncbi:MAG: ferrous iron transport protein B [Bacteroidales bacterium]|nr:ferrous iron transport protein B [Bacteroidales bacterium]